MVVKKETIDVKEKLNQRIAGLIVLLAFGVVVYHVLQNYQKDLHQVIDETNIPPIPDNLNVNIKPFESNQKESLDEIDILVLQNPEAKSDVVVEKIEKADGSDDLLVNSETPKLDQTIADKGAIRAAKMQSTENNRSNDPKRDQEAPVSGTNSVNWLIQVASYHSDKNANALIKKLAESGLKGFSEHVSKGDKNIVRVFVGPYAHKKNSLADKKRIKKTMKLDGLLIKRQNDSGKDR